MSDNNRRLREVAELYRFKDETYNIDGPYHFKESKYWIIQYARKRRFRGIKGSTVIVLSEDGSIVRDWTIYHIISKAYLTPKISSKFIDVYREEDLKLNRIKSILESILNGEYEFNIDDLYAKAKEYEVRELIQHLTAIKINIEDILDNIKRLLDDRRNTHEIIREIYDVNECEKLIKLFDEVLPDEVDALRDIDMMISRQGRLLLDLIDIIRELGMRRDVSKTLANSVNKYLHLLREFKRDLYKMIGLRNYMISVAKDRYANIERYYHEFLNRVK